LKAKVPETQIPQPTSSNGKGKEKASGNPTKTFKVRVVPPRIAATWGIPDVPERQGKVMLCAQNVLDRGRRKFQMEGDVHVRAELVKQEKEAQGVETSGDGKEADEAEKKDEGVEAWLVPWDEMPEGCVVLLGKVEEDWQKWGTVRSAYLAF